jgi:UDP-N-acetyl-D-glucosamine dehydrogenase
MKEQLIQKIKTCEAVVGIVGLGYVGLPLMLRFTEVGFPVLGFDIDEVKVAKLNNGESYIGHIPSAAIAEKRQQEVQLGGGKTVPLLDATSDYSRASETDVLIILCQPLSTDIVNRIYLMCAIPLSHCNRTCGGDR